MYFFVKPTSSLMSKVDVRARRQRGVSRASKMEEHSWKTQLVNKIESTNFKQF